MKWPTAEPGTTSAAIVKIICCRLSGKIDWETFDGDCMSSSWGQNYVGDASRTLSGIECQHWSEQWPHPHSYDDVKYFADYSADATATLDDVANYCRNPVMSAYVDAQAWCYTTDEEVDKEFCDIPRCKRKIHVSVFLLRKFILILY